VAESVELATILLTDLVGSTRLANSVGPVRADELREEHFELLRDAIASSGGTEVKNTATGRWPTRDSKRGQAQLPDGSKRL
jgi:class 3 adenylate cyclase